MFHKGGCVFRLRSALLAAALLACSCEMLAQRGGGGRVGGTAGGGGRPSGVDVNDDLKDFHAAVAVQASSQQIVQFKLMLKSTDAASATLKAFVEQVGKEHNASQVAGPDKTLSEAVEAARAANQKFLAEFSDQQKSGLKEVAKKLSKADSGVEQQTKALDHDVEADPANPQIAASAQKLEHALTDFRNLQLSLGEKMGIVDADNGQDLTFTIAPVKSSVSFDNQPIAITTSGEISKAADDGGQQTFKLQLIVDMADLQQNITEVLRAELNRAESCGEQVAIQSATLTPREPASLVVVHLHFERWACRTGDSIHEMVEGNGTLEVKLTPAIADGKLRLVPEIGHVDAEGLVGELLRSGSLGDALRDKITESILSVAQRGGDFKTALPPAAQGNAVLRQARFEGTGSGKLMVVLDGEIRVSNDKATSLASEMKRQTSAQETVPR